jgi:hypothetical protein
MKALVKKDFYVLSKQMGALLLLILIFSAIPRIFNNVFAIVYAAMLPYTCAAYDERSKWDQLAAMMPYSTRDMVLSKYVLGWLCIGVSAVLSAVLRGLFGLVLDSSGLPLPVILLSVCGACCIIAITLPVMFRFGVEKGRMVMFLMIFLVCASAGALAAVAEKFTTNAPLRAFDARMMAALPLLAVVLTAISIPLSMRLYRRH